MDATKPNFKDIDSSHYNFKLPYISTDQCIFYKIISHWFLIQDNINTDTGIVYIDIYNRSPTYVVSSLKKFLYKSYNT